MKQIKDFLIEHSLLCVILGLVILLPFYIVPLKNAIATEKAYDIFNRHNCLSCHHFTETKIGPAFNDVVDYYIDSDDWDYPITVQVLGNKLRDGGVGRWGNIPMPPMSLHRNESEYIIKWIFDKKWEK